MCDGDGGHGSIEEMRTGVGRRMSWGFMAWGAGKGGGWWKHQF